MRALPALLLSGALAACTAEEGPRCDEIPGEVCLVAGTGERAFNGDGLPAEDTDLNLVSSVRQGPDGLIYIVDFNNMMIRRINEDGSVETLVGSGVHAYAEPDGPAIDSPLENPVDLAWDPDGRIVFASLHDPRILRLDDDGILRVHAGTGELGDTGDGGPAVEARFWEPAGLAEGPDGRLYVTDWVADRVRVIDPDGTIRAFAGTGDEGYDGDGGLAIAAQLKEPTGIDVDAAGNVYVAEHGNHVVRRISAEGVIETIAGTGERGYGGDGGVALDATFDRPDGVAVGDDGSVYISDSGNHVIRRIDPSGTVSTVAGSGGSGELSTEPAPALSAELNKPARVSVAGNRLLIADQLNNCARALYLGE